jgi:hypothetical protein
MFTAYSTACNLVAPGVAVQIMDSVFRVGYQKQRVRNDPHLQKAVMDAFKQG